MPAYKMVGFNDSANMEIKIPRKMTAKGRVLYPQTAEREYVRAINAYMEMVHKVVMKYRQKIVNAYQQEMDDEQRFDSYSGFWVKWNNYQNDMLEELEKKTNRFNASKIIDRIARLARRSTFRQWQQLVKKNFGIDLDESYYRGARYQDIANGWVRSNVDMISTVPQNVIKGLNEKVMNAYRDGLTAAELAKVINKVYGIEKGRAQFWARDQLATLTSQVTQAQHKDAGVTKYKWSSSRDERVRDCHRSFNGHIFEYDNPPEGWVKTKSGIRYTGRRCNPGEDYYCRCVAIPVFDKGLLNLPVKNP